MKKYIFLLSLIFGLGSLAAQTFLPEFKVMPKISVQPDRTAGNDTLNILAVMVEFQPDDYNLTFGDGTFGSIYTKDYGTSIIDPLPHDENYFRSHLEFAKRYFQKASNGRVKINYSVLPQVITVSQTMRNYSPNKKSNDFSPLGKFAEEVWNLADKTFGNVDFSRYDLFIIFHAGVGGEVLLPGSLGNEKDLPSLYLSEKNLKEIFGETFNGFPVNNGNFRITNTVILPETESRETSSFGESFLYELSINGLIVSNIASYMGLPDLFDTETGHSAIGRLGLMDGQSIFAYGGLFPPEPSAWEKVFLGWETPVVLEPASAEIKQTIVNRFTASFSDTTLLKIPINSTEYYLIENRLRDANSNGCVITYRKGNDTVTVTFNKDDEQGFNNDNISLLEGVVLDVDEYDWALPGNGIVIWHIDEKVINEKLAENKINADKNRRGVDVEEADGIQDLGELFTNFLGETSEGVATELDFWYKGNKSELYENKFGPDTKPNTNSNDGANTLLTLKDFSPVSTRMSFKVIFGNEKFRLTENKKLNLSTGNKFINLATGNYGLLVLDDTVLKIYGANGELVKSIDSFSVSKPAKIIDNGTEYLLGFSGNKLNIAVLADSIETYTYVYENNFTTQPAVILENNGKLIVYGGVTGGLVKIGFDVLTKNFEAIEKYNVQTNENISGFAVNGNYFVLSAGNKIFDSDGNVVDCGNEILQVTLTENTGGEYLTVALTQGNRIFIVKNGTIGNEFNINAPLELTHFALAGISDDGNSYILYSAGGELNAVNFQGATASNFPFGIKDEEFYGLPAVVDFNNDNGNEIISFTGKNIYGIEGKSGKTFAPFPVSLGGKIKAFDISGNSNNSFELAVLLEDNTLLKWEGKGGLKTLFKNFYANDANTGFVAKPEARALTGTFFPEDRTYNWPNPVYGNRTFIRTFVEENSQVKIKIFDLGGDLVKEIEFSAVGGMENEVAWDVRDVQSGAYFASVEVKSVSGKTANKIIKIAVVK